MSPRAKRGYTLIEAMIAVMVLSIGAGLLANEFSHYQRATRRARAAIGLQHTLGEQMERIRACERRACVYAFATETATVAGLSPEARSWSDAVVSTSVHPGPDGTLQVILQGHVPEILPPRKLIGLVEVTR